MHWWDEGLSTVANSPRDVGEQGLTLSPGRFYRLVHLPSIYKRPLAPLLFSWTHFSSLFRFCPLLPLFFLGPTVACALAFSRTHCPFRFAGECRSIRRQGCSGQRWQKPLLAAINSMMTRKIPAKQTQEQQKSVKTSRW